MAVNLQAARARQPSGETLRRYTELAQLLTGDATATAEDGVRWVRALVDELLIPGLRVYGVTSDHVTLLVERAAQASSMKANPLPLTRDELVEIITRSL
jgi:alcohol dehydrogenase class IV